MKNEITKALGIFLAISGFIGVIAQLLTVTDGLRNISFFLLFATLFALGLWIVFIGMRRKLKAERVLPQIEKLEDICTGYDVVQATKTDLYWISDLEARVYSVTDAVPKRILEEWYNANNNGFSVIKMKDGQTRVGHLDILPLRKATFDEFKAGKITERDIRGDSLFPESRRDSITELYIESVIVDPPKGYTNIPAIICVLTNFHKIVKRICEPEKVQNIYAIAASKSGDRFLKRLGFEVYQPSAERVDKHDMFIIDYKELVANIKLICGDRIPESESAARSQKSADSADSDVSENALI